MTDIAEPPKRQPHEREQQEQERHLVEVSPIHPGRVRKTAQQRSIGHTFILYTFFFFRECPRRRRVPRRRPPTSFPV